MPVDPFQLLTASDKQLLLDGHGQAHYQRGKKLFHEGDAQPNLYIIRKGLVRVERIIQGQSIAIARYGVDEVLGEIAFLEQHAAFGTVVAEEDVDIDIIEAKRLQAMLASDSGFASRFYHSLALCLGTRLRQILPGLQLPESFGGERPRLARTGQVSERQFPPELTTAVERFQGELRDVETGLKQGQVSRPDAQARVNRNCDDLVGALKQFTEDKTLLEIGMDDLLSFRDMPDVARGLGGYVFRETFPFFMQSATIAHGYEKPRGYPEDRELLERIERNEPEGDGRLGPLIDQWFLGRPLCRARRNSLRFLTAFLQKAAAECATAVTAVPTGPARLTSLETGTALEVYDLLAASTLPFYVTCVDVDVDNLLINSNRAKELGCADRITFLQGDVPGITRGQASISLGQQHVIYALGLCDYLSDDRVRVLLDWIHDHLSPGDWVVLTNRDAASPDRAFTEHILDWPVMHRTQEQFAGLFARSRFADLSLEISREDAGVNLIARCRKN